ncbi:DUF3179 domain-containing protein [Chitinophagaceae bacterium LB-8]|uniref:DUF3179 domain-containing protein n=1 Tax=Paraflavisolibacter caeni TaxID=2982496 RepID=A0A9X3B9J6_9BACT|nr:DUF3179 domain-containing (seleno)protein [Paraflavisolibacter caeni]MCU7551391.1 DUF3179 domain-containing protein [Paraflavisolibacter caeni]
MKTFVLPLGLLLLLAAEILRVYFIMPFPGSQQSNTITIAYWLDQNILWLRLVLLAVIAYPAILVFRQRKRRVLLGFVLLLYGLVFYFFNFRFLAEKMFYQPRIKSFSSAKTNKVKEDKLVLGVEINGEAKAYPLQLIGYHHQVRDTVGGMPVMVTYCTVCRTGRVFSPMVNGKNETFRLVGMDHFNAMFEDASTNSWWRQVSGEAIAGPLKGQTLKELPSQQMTLSAWLRQHPTSTVLQPDTSFTKAYKDLADFDKGTIKSNLEKRDVHSWQPKSWVIGVAFGKEAKAYDWNELVSKQMIQDSLPGLPLLIALEIDTASFHVWNRNVNGSMLQFQKQGNMPLLKDVNTGSTWDMNGVCLSGMMKGNRLQPVQASQEFWHSWQTFHPNTKNK